MRQNRLFNRTRIQLTSFYAIVIGLITLLSGCAIHLVMIRAFERTVNRELDTMGNSDRLYRAIANLINNAIQYTSTDGVVTIGLKSSERQAIVTIKDNGIGISADDLPHIFARFYRVQADRSRNTGGMGLGLAIVRAIVRAHHGSIQVDSQLDLGSTFTVSLPIKAAPSKIYSHQIV